MACGYGNRRPRQRGPLGHASTETTQVYTLLADKVADTEIRAARRKRETRRR
jgi:integrase/recombinase XerD